MLLQAIVVALCALSLSSVQGGSIPERGSITTAQLSHYKKELLVNDIRAKKIDINKKNGNMYIVDVESKLYILKKGETKPKPIIFADTFINTIAVDSTAELVYIGCNDGIKIYNERTEMPNDVPEITEEILEIYVRSSSEIFVVAVQGHRIYKYKSLDTDATRLDITVSERGYGNFVVDADGNYYYNSQDKITRRTTATLEEAIEYNGVNDLYMAVDNYGTVYATGDLPHKSLYRLNSDTNVPELVAKLDVLPTCMCFDENNDLVVATLAFGIYRLKSEDNLSCNTDLLKKMYKKVDSQGDNDKAILALLAEIKDNQNKMSDKYNELLSKMNSTEERNRELEDKVISLEKKIQSGDSRGSNIKHIIEETDKAVNIAIHNVGRLYVNSPEIDIKANNIAKHIPEQIPEVKIKMSDN